MGRKSIKKEGKSRKQERRLEKGVLVLKERRPGSINCIHRYCS